MNLIKRAKTRVIQKIKFLRDTKPCIQQIEINNGCNTQIVHILCDILDVDFLFKVKLLSRLPKPVELTQDWIKTNFKYQEPDFYH